MAEHTLKQFDLELNDLKSRVLLMGGIVEQQMRQAMQGLYEGDMSLLSTVEQGDSRLDDAEIQLDMACNQIIAKRQPTAIDLRIIIGVQKTGLELEKQATRPSKSHAQRVHCTKSTPCLHPPWSCATWQMMRLICCANRLTPSLEWTVSLPLTSCRQMTWLMRNTAASHANSSPS